MKVSISKLRVEQVCEKLYEYGNTWSDSAFVVDEKLYQESNVFDGNQEVWFIFDQRRCLILWFKKSGFPGEKKSTEPPFSHELDFTYFEDFTSFLTFMM